MLRDTWTAKVNWTEPEHPAGRMGEALEGLGRLAEHLDRPMVLIIDEFQEVVKEDGVPAERRLRATIQRHRRVAYVIAGSDESMLMAMAGEHSRPFYRLGERRFLGPIPRTDWRPHLKGVFERAGCSIDADAIERILDLSSDVPYGVQRLALECWREVRLRQLGTFDAERVEERVEGLLNLESHVYATTTSQLTAIQKNVPVAVTEKEGREFAVEPLARRYDIGGTSFRRGLVALQNRRLIRQIYDGDLAVRYAFEDPFFGVYVRRRLKG